MEFMAVFSFRHLYFVTFDWRNSPNDSFIHSVVHSFIYLFIHFYSQKDLFTSESILQRGYSYTDRPAREKLSVLVLLQIELMQHLLE